MGEVRASQALNSDFEAGLRSLIVLSEAFPEHFDVQRLVLFDYLLLHSGDWEGGPPSIHTPMPNRGSEVVVRRSFIERGLVLMASRGLIQVHISERGIEYSAADMANVFLDRLSSDYIGALRSRARWAADEFHSIDTELLMRAFSERLSRWGSEFLFLRDYSELLNEMGQEIQAGGPL